MSSTYPLKKIGSQWVFQDEAVLEDFVWHHLDRLFGYQPLRRQHHIGGNYCDILATDSHKGLVILELKNAQDRYVIQQLTRYYDAHIKRKVFKDEVDYRRKIKLIVISPDIHSDNLIDRKYNKLDYELIQFSIRADQSGSHLILENLNQKVTYPSLTIPTTQDDQKPSISIPPPTRFLLNSIARSDQPGIDKFLDLRKKILSFDTRIKETKTQHSSLLYGKGKSTPCAEILMRKEGYSVKKYLPYLYVWLPLISYYKGRKPKLGRIRLPYYFFDSSLDKKSFLNGRIEQRGWQRTTRSATKSWHADRYIRIFLSYKFQKDIDHTAVESYLKKFCKQRGYANPLLNPEKTLDFWVDIALETWLKRFDA